MSHPLKKMARAIQDEISRVTGKPASYQYALNMLQKHWETAQAAVPEDVTGRERREAVIVKVVEAIAPEPQ